MKAIKHFLWTLLFVAVVAIGGAIAYAYSGWYDLSVGSGHTGPVQWYLNTLRYNAIKRASSDIEVPPLDEAGMFEAGAGAYDRVCAGCHGRPGREPSNSWEPAPPALTRRAWDPGQLFWVVRNGIKMSAMPRISDDRINDEQVWQIAAFLQDAARLTEGEYREIVEPPPEPEPEPATESTTPQTGGTSREPERETDAETTGRDNEGEAEGAVETDDSGEG